ncbi:MAG: hypothetical protein BWY50_01691 [Spirochaetes bacterium ADurb.Bin315]|nr:MAG: hypothetical protein BWY50_01691 [Spirochaetes bacterium ADurb.Bin315]
MVRLSARLIPLIITFIIKLDIGTGQIFIPSSFACFLQRASYHDHIGSGSFLHEGSFQ